MIKNQLTKKSFPNFIETISTFSGAVKNQFKKPKNRMKPKLSPLLANISKKRKLKTDGL